LGTLETFTTLCRIVKREQELEKSRHFGLTKRKPKALLIPIPEERVAASLASSVQRIVERKVRRDFN